MSLVLFHLHIQSINQTISGTLAWKYKLRYSI